MPNFDARIRRAKEAMASSGVAGILVGPGADLRYLTGYEAPALERLTLLVVPASGEPALIVPALERSRAASHGVSVPIVAWEETEDPYPLVRKALGTSEGIACVSDRLWAAFVLRLRTELSTPFGLASTITGPLRIRKDAEEIASLREAARIADGVAEELASERIAGWTERRLSRWIGDRLLAGGCERVSFAIVAAGENAASPHHEPSGRTIAAGESIVCDFGGTVGGYGSDITRTFVIGEPPEDLASVHDVVLRANAAATRAAVPGATCASVDAAARSLIEGDGFGDFFVHRTGHGIGLEEHEEPYIVASNDMPLAPGMTFSIEPGIYVPGRLGVRLEDIVVCTEDGAESLNTAPRDLVVLPR